MSQINRNVCVPYTPKQMYDLINDVATYPCYLPMCSHVQIRSQSAEHLVASITLSKGKLKFDFTTANTMQEDRRIDMKLVDGPFKYLQGSWCFTPSGHDCDIDFNLDFEFSSVLLSLAFGNFFKSVVESMVDTFCDQADHRYGKNTRSGSGLMGKTGSDTGGPPQNS